MNELVPASDLGPRPERYLQPVSRGKLTLVTTAAVVGLGVAGALVAMGTGLSVWAVSGLIYVGLIGWLLSRRRSMIAKVRENDDAVAILNSGRSAEAAAIFDRLARSSRSTPLLHALFVYNLGAAELRLGDPHRAISLIGTALNSGWLKGGVVHVRPLALAGLATAWATLGDLDRAEHWASQAHAEVSPARRGLLLVLDALILVRRGRYDEAIRHIDASWSVGEGMLGATQLRTLRLLRAFAISKGDPSPRAQEELRRWMAGAHPHVPGEFDSLIRHWPEFAEFLRAEGF